MAFAKNQSWTVIRVTRAGEVVDICDVPAPTPAEAIAIATRTKSVKTREPLIAQVSAWAAGDLVFGSHEAAVAYAVQFDNLRVTPRQFPR